jgi:hypothetical protein
MFGYPAGSQTQGSLDAYHSRHAEDYLAKLQRDQAGAGDVTTHNVTVNHGDITVNAPTREGGAIATAVGDEVARVNLATLSNTGLQ